MVANQHRRRAGLPREVLAGEIANVVGHECAGVEATPGYLHLPVSRPATAPLGVSNAFLLLDGRRPQQLGNPTLVAVVAAHHPAVGRPESAVDDRVDDRIERQVLGRRQGREAFSVPQQDVQELVTDDGLDVGVRVAVFAHEFQVHE